MGYRHLGWEGEGVQAVIEKAGEVSPRRSPVRPLYSLEGGPREKYISPFASQLRSSTGLRQGIQRRGSRGGRVEKEAGRLSGGAWRL